MSVVIDASVAVKWFVKEAEHSLALSLIEREFEVIAPDLIFAEAANVLWKKLRMGEVTKEQAEIACVIMPDFFSQVIPSQSLLSPALGFAQKLDHPVYDCLYLACAERVAAKLITVDDRFLGKAKSAGLSHLVASLEEAQSFGGIGKSRAVSLSDAELDNLIELSERFERTLASVHDAVSRPAGPFKFVSTSDLGPAFSSVPYFRLTETVRTLSHDQIRDVVTLAWLGRGYDGSNWSELRDHAQGMLGDDPLRHLNYIVGLLYYLRAGLEKVKDDRSREDPRNN